MSFETISILSISIFYPFDDNFMRRKMSKSSCTYIFSEKTKHFVIFKYDSDFASGICEYLLKGDFVLVLGIGLHFFVLF